MTHTIADLLPRADKFHEELPADIRKYLNDRGISDVVIDRRKIGACTYNRQGWITIPVMDKSGTVIQMVLRKPPSAGEKQKRYLLPKGSKADLFGADLLQENPETILICEGVLDACAAQSLGLCAISGSAGVATFREEWFEYFPSANGRRRCYICFDTDEPGKKGAQHLLERLAEQRPDFDLFIIELPEMESGKDLTDFLLKSNTTDKKEALLALAKPYIPPTSRDKLLDSLFEETSFGIVAPCQGFMNGKGFITVTLRHEKNLVPFTVTSDRECFLCDPDNWASIGYQIDRVPVVDAMPRWEQKQLIAFLRREDGETMSLADAIIYVRQILERYLDFPDPRCFTVIATWIVMTYCYRLFPAIPYIHLTGLKGAGKTKVMQLIALLAFNGELVTSSSSAASITRLVHGNGATLGVDEAENLSGSKDEGSATLQDVLRSGYKQGIYVTKCEKDAKGNQYVIRLDPYSPKALSGIKGLEDALSSRCIEILMLRTTNIAVANAEVVPSSSDWENVRSLIYPAVLLSLPAIKQCMQTFSVSEFAGRHAELWKPLLLLAEVGGSREIHEDILSYALDQVAQKKEDETDAETGKLIVCIDELLGQKEKEFIAADAMFQALSEDDDFAWMYDAVGKRKRGKWLNNALKRLALWKGPARSRSNFGKKEKGYDIERAKLLKASVRLGITLASESTTPVASSP